MKPFLFLLASLACFRLTRLITDDKIFDWLRRIPPPKSKAREGISCPFCVSFYFSTAIAAFVCLYLNRITIGEAFLWQPAIWGASILFNQLFVRLSR